MPGKEKFLLLLLIMDGLGLSEKGKGNAVYQAHTPHLDFFCRNYPFTRLAASGEEVGLPQSQMGNSEVGHLNLGAGRVVYQEVLRISKAIEDGSFFQNKVLLEALQKVKERDSSLHLMGLVSDGGVHSHKDHLYALLELAGRAGIRKVYVHAILDGRDVPPVSAEGYLKELEDIMKRLGVGAVATIAGRYYTMDRDQRWQRTEKAYKAYVYGQGCTSESGLKALKAAYARGETDEFVSPTVITNGTGKPLALIKSQDAVIFFNFRSDRARQISRSLVEKNFNCFSRGPHPPFPHLVCLTEYDPDLPAPVAFPPVYLEDTLGEVLSKTGMKQLRIAETEKYAHVTYFFNGGQEEPFPGEERILVHSPQVTTYDLKPEMSAFEVTAEVLKKISAEEYNFIVLNYANADMVGHTGKLKAAIKAIEVVDRCVGEVTGSVLNKGGTVLITADHGNAEKMLADDGTPHTAHTKNDVPFILVSSQRDFKLLPRGKLADVAPTILKLFSLPVPEIMDGEPLII